MMRMRRGGLDADTLQNKMTRSKRVQELVEWIRQTWILRGVEDGGLCRAVQCQLWHRNCDATPR
jgi:hypothetical protein